MKVKHLSEEATIVVSLWSSSGFFFAPEMCDQIPISGDKVWEMGPQNGSSNLFYEYSECLFREKITSWRFCKNDVRCLVGFFGWMVPHKHWAKWNDQTINLTFFNVEEVRGNWLQNGLKLYGLENNFYVGNHYLGVTS